MATVDYNGTETARTHFHLSDLTYPSSQKMNISDLVTIPTVNTTESRLDDLYLNSTIQESSTLSVVNTTLPSDISSSVSDILPPLTSGNSSDITIQDFLSTHRLPVTNATTEGVFIYQSHTQTGTNSSYTLDVTYDITTEAHAHPGLQMVGGPENTDADIQALVYVFAVVVFYGLVLMVALMGMRVRKRRVARMDDGYAALIDRNEVVRRDTALRQKMNVLRLSGVQDGHLLDQIPEHAV